VAIFVAAGAAAGVGLGVVLRSPAIGVGLGAINGGALGLMIRLGRAR